MSFAVTLRFAGLCALVPDAPLDEIGQMWVVMPDARSPAKNEICKHASVLVVDLKHLAQAGQVTADSSAAAGGKLIWDLHRKEVTIVAQGTGAIATLSAPKDDPDTDIRGVPDLAKIAPDAAAINPRFKEDAGSLGLLSTRVRVRQGELRTRSRAGNLPVFFPGVEGLDTADKADRFAHDCVLQLGSLERLEIQARDLDGGATETLTLEGSDQPCEVTFGNLCGDLWQLELTGIEPYADGAVAGLVRDADFEAFYYLSSPVPATNPKGPVPTWQFGGGWGAKCHLAMFNPFQEAQL